MLGVLLLPLCACHPKIVSLLPVLTEEGEVIIYLQPVPQDPRNLRFTLRAVAVTQDASEIPLTLSLREIRSEKPSRQRLLATGRLPAGSYSGLSFSIKSASAPGEEGGTALQIAEEAVRVGFPIRIERRKGTVLWLEFKPSESIREGHRFAPSFTIIAPHTPVFRLLGYITNTKSNNVTVFDKRLRQVVAVIPTGEAPTGMALDPASRRCYVALSKGNAIDVIDMVGTSVVNQIPLNAGDAPRELALTSDGRTLISTNAGSNSVSFIDTAALIEESRLNVGEGPTAIRLTPSGKRAYVFNTLSNTISVLDVAARSLAATLSTEQGPRMGDFNRRGDRLYVIHEWSPYLLVLDPVSSKILKRVFIGMGMSSLKVDRRTDFVYMSMRGDPMAQESDPLSLIPTPAIDAGGTVRTMTIDDEENLLYLLTPERKTVRIVSLTSRNVVSEIEGGEDPYWVAVVAER